MKDLLIAFVHVFAMMAPWLVFGFLMAGIIAVSLPYYRLIKPFGLKKLTRDEVISILRESL